MRIVPGIEKNNNHEPLKYVKQSSAIAQNVQMFTICYSGIKTVFVTLSAYL